MSDLVTVTPGSPDTAAVATATLGSVLTSLINPNQAVTGAYKYVQFGGIALLTYLVARNPQ